jgi:hypothetical protein
MFIGQEQLPASLQCVQLFFPSFLSCSIDLSIRAPLFHFTASAMHYMRVHCAPPFLIEQSFDFVAQTTAPTPYFLSVMEILRVLLGVSELNFRRQHKRCMEQQ